MDYFNYYPSCSPIVEFLLKRNIKIPRPTIADRTVINDPPTVIGKISNIASTMINPIKTLNALDGNKAEILL